MSGRHFLRSRRRAAEAAIGLLFAETSDDEPQTLDEEDQNFIFEDSIIGVEETIIDDADDSEGDSGSDQSEADIVNFTDDQSIFWDPSTPILPRFVRLPDDGESNSADSFESPIETFFIVAQVDKLIDEIIILQSILYAQQQGIQFQTCKEEIKAFLGITILMGYHRLPSMRDYWSADTDLSVPFVASVMSRERFEMIRKVLHFNDNQNSRQEDRESGGK